jgi:hypothetical protein
MQYLGITFKLFLYERHHSLFPIFISIVNIPLFAETYNADITWSWDNITIRFIILNGQFLINKIVLNKRFCIINFLTFVFSNYHFTFMETFLVTLLFCQCQSIFIILTFYFHFLTNSKCSQITISWDVNNLNRLQCNHFLCYVIFLSECFLIS